MKLSKFSYLDLNIARESATITFLLWRKSEVLWIEK